MDLKSENSNQVGASSFEILGIKQPILDVLSKEGFKVPSSIQEEVIPLILLGRDVIGQAQTGTGKTAAFGLPSIQLTSQNDGVQVLVLTPTRELASQVSEELLRFGRCCKLKVATICGGKSFKNQIDTIKLGAQIVVATPGRLLDLLESKKLGHFSPKIVIVDEADEMLDMGFLEDIRAIFDFLPEQKQTLLFSATMPAAIQALAKGILKNPVFVKAAQTQAVNQDISQTYCLIQEHERDHALVRLFEGNALVKSIIFCKTKKEVDRLSSTLIYLGYLAKGLHGDMEQSQREDVIANFRSGKINILVATDVAARGLNVLDISHVINYHIPFDVQSYVHRIGRTGRAGRKGKAITLVTPKEMGRFSRYQRTVGGEIEQGFIPTKQEIKGVRGVRLLEQVAAQAFDEESKKIITELKNTMDLEEIASVLFSLLLNQHPIDGPEEIGINERKFNKQAPLNFQRENRERTHHKPQQKKNFSAKRKPMQFQAKSKFGSQRDQKFRANFKPKG